MKRFHGVKKILSLAICLALVLSFLPKMAFHSAGAAEESPYTKTADPNTMNDWTNFFGPDVISTEFSGGVWTDKSVFTDASAFPGITMKDENSFLVSLSALSASTQIKGQSSTPTDVMLVLDLSNSMDNSRSIPDMVTATNSAISTLLKDNDYNRIGVVLYSGNSEVGSSAPSTATVLLPLDRYTSTSGNYLAYTGSADDTTVTVASGVKNSAGRTVTGRKTTDGGTYIQNGLFQAWQQFEKVTDQKVSAPGTAMDGVQRMPVFVLMSDGAPTAATVNYFGTTTTNWWGETSTSIGTSTSGDGTTSNDSRVFMTQLTAAWVKESTSAHYGSEAKFYTIGLGTASDANATGVLYPAGSNSTLSGWWDAYLDLADGRTLNRDGSPRVTRKAIVTEMNYVDHYWAAKDSAELIKKFEAITGEIQLQSATFSTLVEAAGSDLSGYVSFEDEIGELMHIRQVKGILLEDTLYTGAELAKAFADGTFGSLNNPSEKGQDLIETMCERIGIDASTAQQLATSAYNAGQLSYTSASEYSNYIGWYSDVNGKYLGHWNESFGTGADTAPSGAVYINKTYAYLGQSKSSDMMHVVVNTRMEIATTHQDVLFRVPAGMLPMVTYEVELEGGNLASGGTMTRKAAQPIRLLYEVGLRADINEVNIDQKVEEYLQEHPEGHVHRHEDGTYEFFTNTWGTGTGNTSPAINQALLPHVTESHFSPATNNDRYYYTEEEPIYVKQGDNYVRYNGTAAPEGEGYYRTRTVISAQKDGGQITVTEKYLPISEKILDDGYVTKTAEGWVVDKGIAFRETTRFDLLKAENKTGTLLWSDHPLVIFTGAADASYDIYAVLGNNGKLTVRPAQGIRVSKTVEEVSQDPEAPKAFDFEITLTPAVAKTALNITDETGTALESTQYSVAVDADKTVIEVSLEDGQQVVVTGLPNGTSYTVEEHQSVYYNTGYVDDKVTGTVVPTEIVDVPFVNVPRQQKELQITKTVNHPFPQVPEALKNKIFRAKVTLTEQVAGHTFYDSTGKRYVADEKGSFVVELRAESSVTIVGILEDTPYTVEEIEIPAGFVLDTNASSGLSGTIPGDAHLVNNYEPHSTPDNSEVTVTVNKKLTGDYSGPEDFAFRLEMLDPESEDAQKDGYVLIEERKVKYPAENTVSFDLSQMVKTFTSLGSHTFRVMEVTGDTIGMTYSVRRATFRVDVVDPEMDGQLKVDVVELTNATVTQTESGHGVSTEFENIYAVDSTYVDIPVSKTLVNDTGVQIDLTGFRFGLFNSPNATEPVNGYTIYAGPTGVGAIRIPVTSLDQHGDVYYLKEIVPADTRAGMTYSQAVYKVTLGVSAHEGTENAFLQATATIVPYSGGGVVTDGNAAFVNTFDLGEAEVALTGDKDLIRGYDRQQMDVASGAYTFQLWSANSDYTAKDLLQTVKNGADGAVAFEKLTCSKVGTYYYLIREVAGSEGYITYDSHDVYVLINVTEDGQGGLNAAVYYRKANEATPAQLAKFTNTYNVSGMDTVPVSGKKVLQVLQGEKNLSGGEFTFVLRDSEGNDLQTATNAPNGTFVFQDLIFRASDVGKTFTYTVSEVEGNNDGIDYDDTKFTFTVEVKDQGDGTIDAVYTLTEGKDAIRFVNEYTAKSVKASFTGTKNLFGRETGLTAGEFTFELYSADKNFENRQFIRDITHDADGKFSFETEEYTATGTYYYVLSEKIPTNEERPAGMHYDAGEFHLTVQVIDRGVGQLEAITTVYHPGSPLTDIVFDNTYIPESVEVPLLASKEYEKSLAGGEFTFQLWSANSDYTPTDLLQTVKNGAGGTVTFDSLVFEEEGTHHYVVKELDGGLAYIDYDKTEYKVEITVTDNNAGRLEATVTVNEGPNTPMVFDNDYKFQTGAELTLTGTKSLTGREQKAGEFSFQVTEGGKIVATGTNSAAGVISFTPISYTHEDIGTHTYEISEVAGTQGGITYDPTVHKITVTVAGDGKGGLTVTRSAESENVVLAFANTYTVTGSGELKLEARKVFNRPLTDGAFSFVLEDWQGNVLQTKQNDDVGNIIFDTITYDADDIGTHYYEIGEVTGNQGGITYDPTVYYVVVTVSDDGEGGVEVSHTVNGGDTEMVFNNVYGFQGEVSVPLSGVKILEGGFRTQPAEGEFTFQLKDSAGNVLQTTTNRADGSFSFQNLTFDEGDTGTHEYWVTEVDQGKPGIQYSQEAYKVEIAIADDTQGGLSVTKLVNGKPNGPIHFTNTYEITKGTEVILEGHKNLTGRNLKDKEFTFHVHEGSTLVATGTNDDQGNITFEKITYNAGDIGVHTYIVHEEVKNLGGVIYDSTRHTVTVTVSDDGKGGLTTEVSGMESLVFNNTYAASGEAEVVLEGSKSFTGKDLEDGMFYFELVEKETEKVLQTVSNTGDKFTFAPLRYTEEGIHEYIVREVRGSLGGVSYDVTEYIVEVTVFDNGTGGFEVETTGADDMVFRNNYTVSGQAQTVIEGEKSLGGDRTAMNAGEFSFRLSLGNTVLQTVTNAADGTFAFAPLIYTADQVGQSFTYTVTEVDEDKLGVDYDETSYTVVVVVMDTGTGTIRAEQTLQDAQKIQFANTYTIVEGAELKLEATKTLTGDRQTMASGEFEFLVMEGDKQVSKGVNNAEGKIFFDTIVYTKEHIGTHTYEVFEVEGAQGGIDYSGVRYTVIVTVSDNGQGGLKVETTELPQMNFVNTYTVGGTGELQLTGTKTLDGDRTEQKAGEFTFAVMDGQTQIASGTNDEHGNIVFETITYDADDIGTHNYTVIEIQGSNAGMTYDTETSYSVEVLVSDNGQGGIAVSYKVDGQENKAITFTNSYTIRGEGEMPISGVKVLTGRPLQLGEFSFQLSKDGQVVETVTNAAGGAINFTTLKFGPEDIGQHVYTVSEVQGDGENDVAYDRTIYTVVITVSDNGNGGVAVTKTVDGSATKDIIFNNSYAVDGEVDVTIAGVKKLDGDRKQIRDQEFSFVLKDALGTELQTVQAAADGSFAFDQLHFTEEHIGSYSYTVSEVKGTTEGMTYDEKVYNVVITVSDNGMGDITATKTVDGEAQKIITFSNIYNITGSAQVQIEGTKELTGRDPDSGEFTFALSKDGTVVQTATNTGAAFAFEPLNFTKEDIGLHTYVVTELAGDNSGVTYSQERYTVAITVSDNGQGGLSVTKQVNGGDADIVFHNTYAITKDAELVLKGNKTLTGDRQEQVAGEFKFLVMEGDKQVSKGVNDAGGNILFDTIAYTAADIGEHTYTVFEEKGTNAGMTYDETKYTVKVSVVDNKQGGLTVTTTENPTLSFVNSYNITQNGELILRGNKTLTGYRTAQTAGEFTFSVTEAGQRVATGTNDAQGNVVFETITYTKEQIGEHTYVIREDVGTNDGMTYDKTEYTVKVTVSDNGNGGLTVTRVEDPTLSFRNEYNIRGTSQLLLTGTKTLANRELKAEEFVFEVTEKGQVVATGKNNAEGNIVFEPITYTADDIGEHTYTVSEKDTGLYSMTYDKTAYTVIAEVSDDGNGGLKVERTADPTIAFRNVYTPDVDVTLQVIKKVQTTATVPPSSKGFEFQLSLGTEDAEGNMSFAPVGKVSSDAQGLAAFAVTYTKEDVGKTFTYKLSEINGKKQGWEYDNTEYLITVAVDINVNGTLKITKTLDGVVAEEISVCFTNTYKPSVTPETGDFFRPLFVLMAMLCAAAGAFVMLVLRRKRI